MRPIRLWFSREADGHYLWEHGDPPRLLAVFPQFEEATRDRIAAALDLYDAARLALAYLQGGDVRRGQVLAELERVLELAEGKEPADER